MSRRIPGPYVFDRAARTIHTATGETVCFGFSKFGDERETLAETLRFLVAAANACQNIDVAKLEAIAAGDRSLEVALQASMRDALADAMPRPVPDPKAEPFFDVQSLTDNLFDNLSKRKRRP